MILQDVSISSPYWSRSLKGPRTMHGPSWQAVMVICSHAYAVVSLTWASSCLGGLTLGGLHDARPILVRALIDADLPGTLLIGLG
jgi:hypothetical protein